VNDVVLAATASTLRTYLLERNALPDRALIASVPVSLRSENEARAFGNRTSNLFVTLPVEIADPVERLMAVNVASSAAKDIHRAMGSDLLGDWADLAPAPLISFGSRAYGSLGLSRLLPPVMNLVVSNVAGPPLALYMAGAAVTGVYPFGPLMEGTGLNLTVLSRCGDLDVGVIACPDLVDDPDAIVDGFAAAVSELLALGTQRL
jgi:WS/DGAT/MGAT family acyltransferase